MAVQLEFLKSIPYFSELSPAELDSIRKLTFEKTESFRIRMWIARQLILLANWLVGIETVIEDE